MQKVFAIALLLAFASAGAQGQRMSGGRAGFSSMQHRGGFPVSAGRRSLIGLRGVPFREIGRRGGYGRGSFYGGWPYYDGWPYWGYDYDGGYDPEVGVQAPPPQSPTVVQKQEPVPDAVLLELQGNRWVRVSSFETATPPSESAPAAAAATPAAAKELPPAVIVFRDGHTEQISSYSIIGATLYAKADYVSSGDWTREIQLAELDLPATIKQNQERGVPFQLPAGPNEVVLRP